MFDYGEENLIRYKSKTPPEYKLANVRTAVHLYRGADDLFTSMIVSENKTLIKFLKEIFLPGCQTFEERLAKRSMLSQRSKLESSRFCLRQKRAESIVRRYFEIIRDGEIKVLLMF